MRLPRMTTRRWMIAVMILATLMGVFAEVNRELRLAHRYRLLAFAYDQALHLDRDPEHLVGGGYTATQTHENGRGAYSDESHEHRG